MKEHNNVNTIKDEVIISFLKKLQKLNDVFIQSNISVMKNPDSLPSMLEMIKDSVFVIIQFYDTNIYDLQIFSRDFHSFQNSWNQFVSALKMLYGKNLTRGDQLLLGLKLQNVKEKNQNLINAVRNSIS